MIYLQINKNRFLGNKLYNSTIIDTDTKNKVFLANGKNNTNC